MSHRFAISSGRNTQRGGFTLIELLMVIGIIVVLVGLSFPALRSLTKSNDNSQAVNLVRSMITNARSIAIAQHRQAGVVFFEETGKYSSPVNGSQTAMQIFVEKYEQPPAAAAGVTEYDYFSSTRQYLPAGVRLAALTDIAGASVESGDAGSSRPARVILFDGNGQLVLRGGLATASPGAGGSNQGRYPVAFGDWGFLDLSTGNLPNGQPGNAYSAPGFFLYDRTEFDAQPTANRPAWLRKNASVVIVNGNTGGVLR
jgi:prepilin-type N-terminal cleavage/methylation domain-containing protein